MITQVKSSNVKPNINTKTKYIKMNLPRHPDTGSKEGYQHTIKVLSNSGIFPDDNLSKWLTTFLRKLGAKDSIVKAGFVFYIVSKLHWDNERVNENKRPGLVEVKFNTKEEPKGKKETEVILKVRYNKAGKIYCNYYHFSKNFSFYKLYKVTGDSLIPPKAFDYLKMFGKIDQTFTNQTFVNDLGSSEFTIILNGEPCTYKFNFKTKKLYYLSDNYTWQLEKVLDY